MTTVHPLVRIAIFPALLALVLAACQAPAPGPAASPGAPATAAATPSGPSGTLTIGMRGDIENTHPYLTYDIVGISARQNMFDNLVEWDYDGKIVPGLAESWKVTGTTVEFKLRRGVKFHNGEDFDAESVKFSIEHLKSAELKSASASNVAVVTEVKVVDPSTVQFVLSRADARLFDVLANNVPIVPAKYIKDVGLAGFTAKPIGTGPFKFVSWTKDDKLVMEANESYWNGSYKGKPGVKTLVFRPIPTAATRVAELKAGSVDVIQDVPPDQFEPLRSAGLEVVESKSPVYTWAFFNTNHEKAAALKDARVRQAMNHAVDTATIIKTVLQGHARQLTAGITDLTVGYDPSLKPFAFDQTKAKDLLKQAGITTLELDADISASQKPDAAEAVIAQLKQVGINVKLNPLPTAVFNDRWVKKQLSPLYFVTWNTFTHPALLDLLAGCKGFISNFCSTEAQKFLDEGGATLDQTAQEAAYKKAVEVFARDPFAIYLDNANNLTGMSKKVQGFKPHGITVVLGTRATVAR
jgi:peptide/nickel transport system substrate-binding protein